MSNTARFRHTVALAVAMNLSWLAAGALAQAVLSPLAPAPQKAPEAGRAAEATPARVVIVEWRIKKGSENEFLEYWATRSTIPDRSGLIGEFLNRVESREQFPWMAWEFSDSWTTFINVGFWREAADFQQQIGRFIDNSRPPLAFEADRRRRVFLVPERWRIGSTPFLLSDHPEVK